MKRKDIKNATIGIIISCIIIFIIIIILPYFFGKKETSTEPVASTQPTIWSDTLSNKASEREDLEPMNRDIAKFMDKWELRGMQIAVSRNDSLLFTKGFGYADAEEKRPMEANSLMRIASSSKLITATAIMKLVEDGKLNLDEKVFGEDGILDNPKFTEAIADKKHFDITVRNLLMHSGGFTLGAGDPMFNTHEIIKAKNLSHAPSSDELIEIVLKRRLGYQPGAGHRYSNFGYMLLSKIIEKKSGENYWDYVNNNLFIPSGISGIKPATTYFKDRLEREVKYYSPDNEQVEEYNGSGKMVDRCYGGADIHGLMGAGGWIASAADISRFVASIDGDSKFPDVISKNSVDAMTAYCGDKEKICIGWTKVDGKGEWMRSGTLSSAHSLIIRFPDSECWVITMNTGVWRGYHFTNEMIRLVERLRNSYSAQLPHQNLF